MIYHMLEGKNTKNIAPDLRDGRCYQSLEADVFSLGKIIQNLCI